MLYIPVTRNHYPHVRLAEALPTHVRVTCTYAYAEINCPYIYMQLYIYNNNYSIYTPPRRSAIPKSVEAQSNVNAPRTRHLTILNFLGERKVGWH